MKAIIEINRTEDGYTYSEHYTERPEDPHEVMELKRIIARHLSDEIVSYDTFTTEKNIRTYETI